MSGSPGVLVGLVWSGVPSLAYVGLTVYIASGAVRY